MNNTRFPLKLTTLFLCYSLHPITYATDNNEATTLQTIKVNARQWKEETIDAPVSTTIIKGTDINETNEDINIIAKKTPNTSLEQSSVQTRVSIRGITGIDGGLQDPVGYFINDVALPLGGNQLPALFNLDSLEIVKGPQGTLYGRNTEAGAVKIDSADPTWDFSGWAELSSGVVDGADGKAPENVIAVKLSDAINEDLAGSFAIRGKKSDGPYLNTFNNENNGGEVDQISLSAGLTYIIGDNTDIEFKSITDNNDMGRNRFRFSTGNNATERFTTNTNLNGFDDDQISVHSIKVNHSFDNMDLVSITGFTDYERQFSIDQDVNAFASLQSSLDLENDSTSQEFRFSSNNDNAKLKWLAGIYLYDEESEIEFINTATRSTQIDQQGNAIFGQFEYSIAPTFSVSLGGRYEKIDQTGNQNYTFGMANSAYSVGIDESEFLPKASISYKPTKNNLMFLAYSEGYLPGGYNYNSANSATSFTFNPEYSSLIELGWKNTSIENRLNTSITLFHNSTDDKQIVDLLPGFSQSISNAGETEIYGAEFGLDYQITSAWSSYVNLGIQRSEAVSFTTNQLGNTLDLSGNELPLAPESTYSAGIEYARKKGLFGLLAFRGSSRYYFDSQNTLQQPSFSIIDSELGYRFTSSTLSFWVKNIGDEEVISRAVTVRGNTVVEDALPRTFGLKLTKQL